jgi:AraC-like DNA-binding protein
MVMRAVNLTLVTENKIVSPSEKRRLLSELQVNLTRRDHDLDRDLMHCSLGVQSCYRPQNISKVTFSKPALLVVVSGSKEIELANRRFVARAGECLIVPADTEFWIAKYPDPLSGLYLGLGLRFDIETIEAFQRNYGRGFESWNLSSHWQAPASEAALEWIIQWLEWSQKYPPSVQVQRHRLMELLLVLAQSGIAGNILFSRNPSWRQRIGQLIGIDPARDWKCQDLCRALGVSESALRRHLHGEGSSFRGLLEETRLMSGLNLVQETSLTICQVADAVGYRSQSRFTDRFKERFGVTPTGLRRSGTDAQSEALTRLGEPAH